MYSMPIASMYTEGRLADIELSFRPFSHIDMLAECQSVLGRGDFDLDPVLLHSDQISLRVGKRIADPEKKDSSFHNAPHQTKRKIKQLM